MNGYKYLWLRTARLNIYGFLTKFLKKYSFEDSLMQWRNIVQGRIRRKARGALVYGANVRAFRRRSGVAGRIIAESGLSKPRGAAAKHILFIVIDCLRRDHLSLYGYHRETTPFLKSVATGNSVFQNAVSPSSWTYSSVASMLTGLYPHSHRRSLRGGTKKFQQANDATRGQGKRTFSA